MRICRVWDCAAWNRSGLEISARAILAQAQFGSPGVERSTIPEGRAGALAGTIGHHSRFAAGKGEACVNVIETHARPPVDQRIISPVLSGIAHDLEANKQFHIARRSA